MRFIFWSAQKYWDYHANKEVPEEVRNKPYVGAHRYRRSQDKWEEVYHRRQKIFYSLVLPIILSLTAIITAIILS